MNSIPSPIQITLPFESKVCCHCKHEQPISQFSKNRSAKDGLQQECKTCNRARYERNPEDKKAQVRQHHHAILHDPVFREKRRARKKRWQAANPVKVMAALHTHRARTYNAEGHFTAQEWEDLKARYQYRCLRCGKQEPEIKLTVDHVIPLGQPGSSNWITNIQPLCFSCNRVKRLKHTDYRPSE